MRLLTGKTYITKTNNWYAPTCEFHEKYPSIEQMVFTDQSSSAGDWCGFLIQRTGKNIAHCIAFEQVNNYPHDGFTLYTAEHPFCAGNPNIGNFVKEVTSCWNQFAYDKNGELR